MYVLRKFTCIGFFFVFFLVDEGRKDPNTTEIWPSPACQRNAIEMTFRWRADDGPTLNAIEAL